MNVREQGEQVGDGEQALVGNAADSKQVKDARKREEHRREQELNDLRTVLGVPAGRRLLWRILLECHILGPSWRPESGRHMAFIEGERNIGLWLARELEQTAPEAFAKLMLDAKTPPGKLRENT